MIRTPLPQGLDPNLYQILLVILQKAIDGTVVPIFVDTPNQRIIIGGVSSLGSNAPLQVQSGDIEITTAGKGIIIKDDGGTTHTARLTFTYDPATQNWNTNLSTIS